MALFHRQYLKAITLIESQFSKKKFNSIATGFLVGFLSKDNVDPLKKEYRLFLLTNRHVFEGSDQLWVRFDNKDGKGTERFPIYLKVDSEIKWLAHRNKDVDMAMLTINPQFLKDKKVDWDFIAEDKIAYPENFVEIGIELGDGVFLVGFPLGISGRIQNYALVRNGIISRIDKEIINSNKCFMIDASVFPGNSGGPVFLRPELSFLGNTKAVNSPYLLGVVSGYLPYKEPLYSHQAYPHQIAGYSMENSGLATVVPMNFAKDIYNDFIKKQKKMEKEIKSETR
ncbi:MAG: serine protease [Candidatus Paceibacterota bacterium]|jgi:hypothetical protein